SGSRSSCPPTCAASRASSCSTSNTTSRPSPAACPGCGSSRSTSSTPTSSSEVPGHELGRTSGERPRILLPALPRHQFDLDRDGGAIAVGDLTQQHGDQFRGDPVEGLPDGGQCRLHGGGHQGVVEAADEQLPGHGCVTLGRRVQNSSC